MNSDLNNAFNALSLSSIAYCESRGLSIETMSRFGLLESKCNRYLVIPVCDSQGGQLFSQAGALHQEVTSVGTNIMGISTVVLCLA